MTKTSTLKRTVIGFVVVMQVIFYPASTVFAAENDGTTSDSSQSSQPADNPPAADPAQTPAPPAAPTPTPPVNPSPATGPSAPTGADAQTYHQNPNGTWSNDYYTWDPVTGQTRPNTPQDYSYNPTTGMWDTVQYRYDAPAGKYVPNVVSVPQNPNPSSKSAGASPQSLSSNDPSNTGPNSNNTSTINTNNNGFFNGFLNTTITNTISSSATTGNASVVQNTAGGSALSGDASIEANLLNLLQSSWNPNDGGPLTFTANIDGDVNGDLYVDPSMIDTTGPNSLNATNSTTNNNLQVNSQTNGTINNNVDLAAKSGNATVSGNTSAGNAKSGNAQAVANIVNMINSAIHSGKSFYGVININGNLNGDILLPTWLQTALQNTGPNSNNSSNQTENTNLNVNLTDNKNINNNVNAAANTGSANVDHNTSAGNATTGAASTNVTLLNLTGKKVYGKDAILVFVNVFGKWVGLIMNAPAGSNSSLIGSTGPNSSNTNNSTTNNNTTVNSTTNNTINNNLHIKANTGDASVSDNTSAGDAESGDASAGANIANIIDSSIDLSDWFGVLFINVFGSWMGSFGIDTAAGNAQQPASTTTDTAVGGQGQGQAASAPSNTTHEPFTFIPHDNTGGNVGTDSASTAKAVLADSNQSASSKAPTPALSTTQHAGTNLWLVISGVTFALGLLGLERFLTFRRR